MEMAFTIYWSEPFHIALFGRDLSIVMIYVTIYIYNILIYSPRSVITWLKLYKFRDIMDDLRVASYWDVYIFGINEKIRKLILER